MGPLPLSGLARIGQMNQSPLNEIICHSILSDIVSSEIYPFVYAK